jgi:hypothetical protein
MDLFWLALLSIAAACILMLAGIGLCVLVTIFNVLRSWRVWP